MANTSGNTMEPVRRESVMPSSLDPQRRYQSMLATVNILNQARKGRRKSLGSVVPLTLTSSSSSSIAPPVNRWPPLDHRNPITRAKTQWQTAVGKIMSSAVCNGGEGTDVKDLGKSLGKDGTAVGMATAEVALRRRKFRKWRHDRKKKLYLKFRRVAWLAILVRRICRMHYIEVSDTADLSFAQVSSSRDSIDVMFDVTQFKAKKQKLLSKEAKRILQTPPEKRTPQEIYYVQIAIRGLQAIAAYPVRMQRSLAAVGWYEAYGPSRVIIREGHKPRAFYFLYSGSVVVTVMDPGRLTQRTVAILKRGDSFGELAILNACSRTSTVTARKDVQLLVISAEDFMKIFMSGGVKRLTDPDHLAFIRSIDFLKGWPIQLLDLHPKKCVFNFFRRDTVLVRDSKYSDWIYIVKSGSCSVVMRLSKANAQKRSSKNKTKKANPNAIWKNNERSHHHLTPSRHEERLVRKENSFLRSKVRLLQRTRPSGFRRGLNPPLRRAPDARNGHGVDMETAERETAELRRLIEASVAKEEEGDDYWRRRDRKTDRHDEETESGLQDDTVQYTDGRQRAYYGPRRTFADDLNARLVKPISNDDSDSSPVFVCVRILVKGGAFGLSELMFSDQPSLSLVSNGAECVVMSKQFFLEHAPEHLIHDQIRLSVTPYGSADELQVNFEKELSWKHYRDVTLRKTVNKLRTDRAALNKLSHSF